MSPKKLSFNKIKIDDLVEFINIREINERQIFHEWFDYNYKLTREDKTFLNQLIDKYRSFIYNFVEEELKIKFIAPILNRVDFFSKDVKDWYERPLKAKVNKVWLRGTVDYMVAKGISVPKRPYFFIQEFKKARGSDSDPKAQLLAEMLAAMTLNKINVMRGAYIIGRNWNFVILEKHENDYQYVVSKQFDSLEIEYLQQIYISLQAVKHLYCKD